MYDWLKEHFKDLPKLSQKTVFNFVSWVRRKHNLLFIKTPREYEMVEKLPYGKQAQVDFGEYNMRNTSGNRVKVFFFILTLSSSRFKYVWFTTKYFTSRGAVAPARSHPGTGEGNGIHVVRVHHTLPRRPRRGICKSQGLPDRESGAADRHLGYDCHGTVCPGGESLWGKGVKQSGGEGDCYSLATSPIGRYSVLLQPQGEGSAFVHVGESQHFGGYFLGRDSVGIVEIQHQSSGFAGSEHAAVEVCGGVVSIHFWSGVSIGIAEGGVWAEATIEEGPLGLGQVGDFYADGHAGSAFFQKILLEHAETPGVVSGIDFNSESGAYQRG